MYHTTLTYSVSVLMHSTERRDASSLEAEMFLVGSSHVFQVDCPCDFHITNNPNI